MDPRTYAQTNTRMNAQTHRHRDTQKPRYIDAHVHGKHVYYVIYIYIYIDIYIYIYIYRIYKEYP